MASFRAGMETGFERFGELVFRHSVRTLLLVALLAGGLISQLPWITFDTSTESFFHPDDPALIDYNAFREQFGRDQFIVIAVKPPDVFERAFLEKLKVFHDRLVEKVPHLKEVNSLINIRDTRGEGDTLVVEDLLKTLPATPQAMAALKKRVLSSNLYPNLIISEDGRFTTVLLETHAFSGAGGDGDDAADLTSGFDDEEAGGKEAAGKEAGEKGAGEALPLLSDAENTAVIKAVEGVTKEFEGPRFRLFVAGAPAVTTYLKRAMQENMRRFVGLALLAIAAFLLILFRRLSGVFLPMLVVILSLASTVGLMSLTGVSFKLPLMILPTFLLAVGIGASVHLLVIFFRHYDREGNKAAALKYALGHSGLPILMTSITTAAGLLSFSTASLAAVADLGKFAAAGVGLSLVYTLAMVPALLALLPVRRGARSGRASGAAARPPLADRVLSGLGRFATTRPWTVLAASLLIVVGGSAGLANLKFSHNNLLWFPADSPIRLSTELIDRE
ncbi:MAG: MMPL family transporter, partial [bacterium]